MSIRQAVLSDLDRVKYISEVTISEIYPHYYPKGAVDFFLGHHREDNILSDIEMNHVFLYFDAAQDAIGTVTIKQNEICRLFVLPSRQGPLLHHLRVRGRRGGAVGAHLFRMAGGRRQPVQRGGKPGVFRRRAHRAAV